MPTGSLASARVAPAPSNASSSVTSFKLFPRADRRAPIPVEPMAGRAKLLCEETRIVFIRAV